MLIKLNEWKTELNQREGGKERLVNVVQLDIHRHAALTHTQTHTDTQTKSTQLYLTVINNMAQQLHPV